MAGQRPPRSRAVAPPRRQPTADQLEGLRRELVASAFALRRTVGHAAACGDALLAEDVRCLVTRLDRMRAEVTEQLERLRADTPRP